MRGETLEKTSAEPPVAADKIVDKVFDKVGSGAGEGYFENPERLLALTQDALARTPRQAIDKFKDNVNAYKSRANEKYQAKAAELFERTRDNVQNLVRNHRVGGDTVKVFLDPDFVSSTGRGRIFSEYNKIQSDYSRRDEESQLDPVQTYQRYYTRAKLVADDLKENVGDVSYQKEVDEDSTYYPEKPLVSGQFIHVNSQKPQENGGLRCYITADKNVDPSAVLYAWNKSFQNSPLKYSLYFKFATTLSSFRDGGKQRPDDIVIYKTDDVDDGQFKELLRDFQRECRELSPDILPSDEGKMPATTQKIADGISIAGEPSYVNDFLRYTDHKEGKHSWTTFVDKMVILSASVAANRLGVRPSSLEVPELENEMKKVFREFMLLSKINPDTMLPTEYGDDSPEWAKLEE